MYNENGTAQYPATLPQMIDMLDTMGATEFFTTPIPITIANGKAKTYRVPTTAPYAIRLEGGYVPQQNHDDYGNPTGVTITGMAEVVWDKNSAPSTGKFMVNYINGEIKFGADAANMTVQPEINAVQSRVWAEAINSLKRELAALLTTMGTNPHQGYQTVGARITANENEVQAARGTFANLAARLVDLNNRIQGVTSASVADWQPKAATGVLGSSVIYAQTDLTLKPGTVNATTVTVKNSLGNVVAVTAVTYDDTAEPKITITHDAFADDVYTVYLSGVRDIMNRVVPDFHWAFGVGNAIANDKPNVTGLQVVNPSKTSITIKGTITDTESDTIARLDFVYSPTNNPLDAAAITMQFTGADIDAFKGAGKQIVATLTAGNYYAFARAVETMSGGGQQIGDWSTGVPFIILADQVPGQVDYTKIVMSSLATAGYSIQLLTANQPTDPDNPEATITFDWAEDTTAGILVTGITAAQINAGYAIVSANTAGASVSGFMRAVSSTSGAGPWSDAKTFSIPTHLGATVAPTITVAAGNLQCTISQATAASGYSGGATHASFNVYRDGVSIAAGAALPYVDTGRTNGTSYSYQVEDVDSLGGASAKSASVSGVPGGIHYYSMDELSGAIVTDTGSSGTKYNGTATGTTIVAGYSGNARSFAGGTDGIAFTNPIIPIGAKTIKFKVKKDALPSATQMIMDNTANLSTLKNGIAVGITTGGVITVSSFKAVSGAYRFSLNGVTNVCNNAWHDVKITWDGTANTNGVKVYVDSVLDIQGTADSLETTQSIDNLYLGGASSTTTLYRLIGSLDEVGIYNVVV